MSALTRRGRLSVTLALTALLTVAIVTYGNPSPGYVFLCSIAAAAIAIGLALTICEYDDRRHRRVVISTRRRYE